MLSRTRIQLASAILSLSFATLPAHAIPFVEGADAGDSIGTAADTGVGASSIAGTLNANPNGPDPYDLVDLFRINISAPGKFVASTGDGFDPFLLADPVLYLFDAAGLAVVMNDDANGSQSTIAGLPAGFSAGFYYLAISFAGVEPTNGVSSLFDVFGSGDVIDFGPLGGWQGGPLSPNFDIPGAYLITLSSVPEPGSLLLLGLGALTLALRRRVVRPIVRV